MFFFDTYAILEIIKGNKAYNRFAEYTIKTSILNLAELYYTLLNKYGKQTADYWYEKFNFDFITITPDVVKKAAHFRFLNKKKNFSLIDCIGYILALQYGLKFLTGDKEFCNLKGVEFVK